MTNNVTPLFSKPEEESCAGQVLCCGCGHKWAASSLIGTVSGLECPECGCFKGNMVGMFGASENGEDFQCNCGSWHFSVYRADGRHFVRCGNCGVDATMSIFE